jgi:predicted Zn-ribbon and HTH transcriptional regulator
MISKKIVYDEATCKRCEHTWNPVTPTPRVCPRCKSYDWQKERVRKGLVREDK